MTTKVVVKFFDSGCISWSHQKYHEGVAKTCASSRGNTCASCVIRHYWV